MESIREAVTSKGCLVKNAMLVINICLLFLHSSATKTEEVQLTQSEYQIGTISQECYKCYFLIKEILRYFIVCTLFIDFDRIDTISIACTQCHYKLSASYIWTWLIWVRNEELVKQMRKLVRSSNDPKLAEFLLYAQQQEHIWCPKCLKDDGWYIAGQEISAPSV